MTDPASPVIEPNTPAEKPIPKQPIRATYGRYYRNARFIMVLAIFVMAAWFGYDGWVAWPAQNVEIDRVEKEVNALSGKTDRADIDKRNELAKKQKELGTKHSDLAITLQKLLAIGLPLIGIGYIAFVVRRSRGTFVMENDTLNAPGHPPVPIAKMIDIDGKLWRKKGIAFVSYENIDGQSGRIRLDAFIYSPKPMDDIYELIARHHGIWEQTKPLPAQTKK